jgi:hypothetical protein
MGITGLRGCRENRNAAIVLVRAAGLEPARDFSRGILSPLQAGVNFCDYCCFLASLGVCVRECVKNAVLFHALSVRRGALRPDNQGIKRSRLRSNDLVLEGKGSRIVPASTLRESFALACRSDRQLGLCGSAALIQSGLRLLATKAGLAPGFNAVVYRRSSSNSKQAISLPLMGVSFRPETSN